MQNLRLCGGNSAGGGTSATLESQACDAATFARSSQAATLLESFLLIQHEGHGMSDGLKRDLDLGSCCTTIPPGDANTTHAVFTKGS